MYLDRYKERNTNVAINNSNEKKIIKNDADKVNTEMKLQRRDYNETDRFLLHRRNYPSLPQSTIVFHFMANNCFFSLLKFILNSSVYQSFFSLKYSRWAVVLRRQSF